MSWRRCDLGGWQRHDLIFSGFRLGWARHLRVWFLKPEYPRPSPGGFLQCAAVLDRAGSLDQEAMLCSNLTLLWGEVYPTQALHMCNWENLIGWPPVPRGEDRGRPDVCTCTWTGFSPLLVLPLAHAAHDTDCINARRSTKPGGIRQTPRVRILRTQAAGHVCWYSPSPMAPDATWSHRRACLGSTGAHQTCANALHYY